MQATAATESKYQTRFTVHRSAAGECCKVEKNCLQQLAGMLYWKGMD